MFLKLKKYKGFVNVIDAYSTCDSLDGAQISPVLLSLFLYLQKKATQSSFECVRLSGDLKVL